jgi:TonB family protein
VLGEGLTRGKRLDTSWKFSRARVAALAAAGAVHVLLIYLLVTLDSTRTLPRPPWVRPIVVSFIDESRPPIEVPVRIHPKLVKLQIRPPRSPDFLIDVPADPIPSVRPGATPAAGSPGLPGAINQAGGPLTLNVVHYVAPIYPPQAVRAGEHGNITMALLVNTHGSVDQIKVLHGTGSSRLDRSAVSAVRQWTFASDKSAVRSESVWGQVSLRFVPPQRFLRFPVIVMPYAAIEPEIDAEIAKNRALHPESPLSEVSVRSLLQKLITAFPSEQVQEPCTLDTAGNSVEMQLGLMGPIQSLTFLGFVDHGIDRDQSDSADLRDPRWRARTNWEVYDIKQDFGSSVWLVATTERGSIQRIEVAIR